MSYPINTVTLCNVHLTRDAELKYAQDGKPRLMFSVAVGTGKDKPADFFDCVYFGDIAAKVAQYMLKGTKIGLEGKLVQRRWEKDGQKRSTVEVVCRNVVLIGSKPQQTEYRAEQQVAPANDGYGDYDGQF